jgi:protein-L-isoaspartate(D-aspartate) O-methyltransferase
MIRVDRKHFVPDDLYHNAYADMPRPIGWNTTISAPHMHAMTLDKLKDHLIPGGKALDLGAGSGYVAACFAEMMGKDSHTYMIDHIKDITDFALNNIKKGNKALIKTKRIIPFTLDARKGLPQHGPYNVIHVGGAMDRVPKELED